MWTEIFPYPGSPNGSASSSPVTLRTDIQEACPGAGQSRLPGGMVGVSKGTAKAYRRKTPCQGETGGRREELERRQKERREAATVRLASYGLSILNIARHCLKEQEREEKTALRDRPSQAEKPERLRRFKPWLGKRSPHLGNLWRFRNRIAPGVEVRIREFPKVGTLASPYAATGKWSKSVFPKRWMSHGWMRPLPCTCVVPDTRGRR